MNFKMLTEYLHMFLFLSYEKFPIYSSIYENERYVILKVVNYEMQWLS